MAASRAKRPLKVEETPGKKSKRRHPSFSDDEDSKGHWSLKSLGNDFPSSSIYNTTSRSQPAELFRKDLISAMKLPDSEPLSAEDYWLITDQWKQEWEKGVQVPVNPDAAPDSIVKNVRKRGRTKDFKLPNNYIRTTHDEFFSNDLHQLSNAPAQAEQMCRYDLDNCDVQWLKALNVERVEIGLPPIDELTMEQVIEELETQCYDNIQHAIQNEAGLGIEYDEDVICDVCRSPDSEEGNEMVFCDSCDICVHQACYGITSIPQGSWMCRTCVLAIKPSCLLCPNKGGAMKSTRSGQKWAHVSCALWIPEVSIGCVDKMEPITKISHIPTSRWALVCCICRDRVGACIQCSVKTCKTAYHVTCAFQDGLQMKAIVEDENDEDGVKLRSYCPKHSKSRDGERSSDSESDEVVKKHKKKKRKCNPKNEATLEENANARAQRLQQIESDFFNHVSLSDIVESLPVDSEVVDFIFTYWKLKRAAGFNKPLITPKAEETDLLGREQEDSLYARMRMFVHLRQDLERVRNLCYMVNRREKLSRSWCRLREQIFHKQVALLTDGNASLSEPEKQKLMHATHGNSVYDQLYSYDITCCVKRKGKAHSSADGSPQKGLNGLVKGGPKTPRTAEKQPNPYAKTYFNGRSQRRSAGTPGSSGEPNLSSSTDRLELNLSSNTSRTEDKTLSEGEQGTEVHQFVPVDQEDIARLARRCVTGSLDESLRVPAKDKFCSGASRHTKSDDSSTFHRSSSSSSSLEEESVNLKKDELSSSRTSRDKSPPAAPHNKREKQTEEKSSKRSSTSERRSSNSVSLQSKKRTKSQDETTASSSRSSSSKNKDKRLRKVEVSSPEKCASHSKSGNEKSESLSRRGSSGLNNRGDSCVFDASGEKGEKAADKSVSRSEHKSTRDKKNSASTCDRKNSASNRDRKNSSSIYDGKSNSHARERKSSSGSSTHERSRSTSASGGERKLSVSRGERKRSISGGERRNSNSSGKVKEKTSSNTRKSSNTIREGRSSSGIREGKSDGSLHEEKNSHGLREGKSSSRLREGKHSSNVEEVKPTSCERKSSCSEKHDKLEKSRLRNKISSSSASCLRSSDNHANVTETPLTNDISTKDNSSSTKSGTISSSERKLRLAENSASVNKTKDQHKSASNVHSVKNVNSSKRLSYDAGMNPGVVITKLTDMEVDRSIKRNHTSIEEKRPTSLAVGKRKGKSANCDKVPDSKNSVAKKESAAEILTVLQKAAARKELENDSEKEQRKEKRKRLEEKHSEALTKKHDALKKDHRNVSKDDKKEVPVTERRKAAKGKIRDSSRGEKREACRAEKRETTKAEKLEASRADKREATKSEKFESSRAEKQIAKVEKRDASGSEKPALEEKHKSSRAEKRDPPTDKKRKAFRVDKHNAMKAEKTSREEKREVSVKDKRKSSKDERRNSSRDVKHVNLKEKNTDVLHEDQLTDSMDEMRIGQKKESRRLRKEKPHETKDKHQSVRERKGASQGNNFDSLKDIKNHISKVNECEVLKVVKRRVSKDKGSKDKSQLLKDDKHKYFKNMSKGRSTEKLKRKCKPRIEDQHDAIDDELLNINKKVFSKESKHVAPKKKCNMKIDSSESETGGSTDTEDADVFIEDQPMKFGKKSEGPTVTVHKRIYEIELDICKEAVPERSLSEDSEISINDGDILNIEDSDVEKGKDFEMPIKNAVSQEEMPEKSVEICTGGVCQRSVPAKSVEMCVNENSSNWVDSPKISAGKLSSVQEQDHQHSRELKFDILKDCEEISDDDLEVSNEDDISHGDELEFSNDDEHEEVRVSKEDSKDNSLGICNQDTLAVLRHNKLIELEKPELDDWKNNEVDILKLELNDSKESEPEVLNPDHTEESAEEDKAHSIGYNPEISNGGASEAVTEEDADILIENKPSTSIEDEPTASVEDESSASVEGGPYASVKDEPNASTKDELEASIKGELKTSIDGESENSVGEPENSVGEPENSVGEPENSVGEPENSVGEPENSVGEPENSVEGELDALVDETPTTSVEEEPTVSMDESLVASMEEEPKVSFKGELEASVEDEVEASVEDKLEPSVEDEAESMVEASMRLSVGAKVKPSVEDDLETSVKSEQEAWVEDEPKNSIEKESEVLHEEESVSDEVKSISDEVKSISDEIRSISDEEKLEVLGENKSEMSTEGEPEVLNEEESQDSNEDKLKSTVEDDLKISDEEAIEVVEERFSALSESSVVWSNVIPKPLKENEPKIGNDSNEGWREKTLGHREEHCTKVEKKARREEKRRENRLKREKLYRRDTSTSEETRVLRSRCPSPSDVASTYHIEKCFSSNEIKIIVRPPLPISDKDSDVSVNRTEVTTRVEPLLASKMDTWQNHRMEPITSRSELCRKASKKDKKRDKDNDEKERNLRDSSCERWKWRLRESHARNPVNAIQQPSPNSEDRSPVCSPPVTPKVDHSSDQCSTSSASPKRERTPTQENAPAGVSKSLECLFPSPSSNKLSYRLSNYRISKKSRSESDEGEKEAPPSPLPIPTVVIPLVDLEEEENSLKPNSDNNRLINGEGLNDVVFSSPSLPPPASPPPFSPSSSSPPPTPTIAESSSPSSPTVAEVLMPAPVVAEALVVPSPQLLPAVSCPPPQNPPLSISIKALATNSPPSPERKIHQVQIIHPENNRSPRLIIKLRKDPNYPESPRWRRDSDYDSEVISVPPSVNCDADTVKKPIRLRLSTRPYTKPLPPPEKNVRRRKQKRSYEPSSNKYSMRSRSVHQDSSSKYSHTEPS